MLLTDRKLKARVNELQAFRYRDKIEIPHLFVKEDIEKIVNPVIPTNFENWDIMNVGDKWAGRDKYLWLHTNITIPSDWKGKKALGVFDFGNTGVGNNSGFESMLYLEGKPYQGVDTNHKESFFKDYMYGKEMDITFRLWSGLEGGGEPKPQEHKIECAFITWLDECVDGFYYMSEMILDTIKNLSDNDSNKVNLRTALDLAYKAIDWSHPGDEAFYDSVYKASEILNTKMGKMEKHTDILINCVGHTHIDVAWLWQLKHTREKISRSFSTVLRLMEQYPEYIFLQTQPQLYEYIKQDFPEIYEKIKEKVREGTWECDGAMWVEADCNLTSGESLTRQILLGANFIKEEFGNDVSYLWLPDVFGYSWALPQILKKSGIDMFMTTKISWNQFNRMPHDTFKWKGIDGSEILAHFITTPDPWSEPGSWFYTYNGQLTPKTVKGSWDAYSEKEINKNLLISYGYGDGGGGVNRDNLEQRRCIDKIPGLPHLKPSTAREYFNNLKETFNNTEEFVHTWDGELYLEYHRGTYTSQAYNKDMNRKMELLYRKTEWLTAMNAVLSGDISKAEQETLTIGWKNILTNQFHDIIPGSSIREVYEDSIKDYEEINKIGTDVLNNAINNLITHKDDVITIINSAGWNNNGLVELPTLTGKVYADEKGNALPCQIDGEKTLIYIDNIPSMGTKSIIITNSTNIKENSNFIVNGKQIETPFYNISFNEKGQIDRIFDKEHSKEIIAEGKCANVLKFFEDKPLDNDAWDIDIFYQEKMNEVSNIEKFEITANGELTLNINIEWTYMETKIAQNIVFYSKNRRIDFKTYVDFHQKHQVLKAEFPVDLRSTYATYDVQYGNVQRPNHWNTSWDIARFETVAHKWVDLSERNYGVSLLNDCKYGHDIKDNIIRVTLLRGATNPDYLQDQGEHFFTYSLLPHEGDFIKGNTVQEAFNLNEPLMAIDGQMNHDINSFIEFSNDCVEIDAIKKSEDGKLLVVRFHEFEGSSHNINVSFGFKYTSWAEGDLLERQIDEFTNNDLTLKVKPFEIKTLLVRI